MSYITVRPSSFIQQFTNTKQFQWIIKIKAIHILQTQVFLASTSQPYIVIFTTTYTHMLL